MRVNLRWNLIMNKVMILGGYGTFGKRISELLTTKNISVIVAGRDAQKAQGVAKTLPAHLVTVAVFDAHRELAKAFETYKPKIVINTIGPFQNANYRIAEICIEHGIHYIDLADARDFVVEISALDQVAKDAGVAIISGASTVPALSSAVLDHYLPEFDEMTSLKFGITPGQRIDRGLATTTAILSYVGKPLKSCAGFPKRYGWQDNYLQDYPKLGKRWMANCDVPDLDLLPSKYGLKSIQFSAGMENPIVHFGIWGLGWLRRLGLPLPLERFANPLLKLSKIFNLFGSNHGAMHMMMTGRKNGQAIEKSWFVYGWNGDGPYIPTGAAVVLVQKILRDDFVIGAYPAVGLVTLNEYETALASKQIEFIS